MSERDATEEVERDALLHSLELDQSAMRVLAARTEALVEDYFESVRGLPVFPRGSDLEEIDAVAGAGLPLEGEDIETIIEDCRKMIAASRHNGHPRFFGYVASPPTAVGAYADLIASALNQNVTSWRSAPAATAIEKRVVRWLGAMVGYGESASGILTSGGSMANLTAMLIAHRAKSPEASAKGLWSSGQPMTVYASDQVHLSIPKAADVLGLGREQVRIIKTDERFRMDVRSLRERIDADMGAGLKPFSVVASAGTVNTGAVDPLAEIAEVAEEHGLWFHVDGAYGALAALDQTKRPLFDGIERADSLSVDAHKWLYAPVDCGCLLFRESERARVAFSAGEADYIKVHEVEEREAFAFWDYGVELSRRFRALKVWMMLRYYGARRVSAAISHDNQLAQYLAERVRASEEFELLAPVELSICCFRYAPPAWRAKLEAASNEEERETINLELDHFNARIMHAVQRGGQAYVSNASLSGRFALRASITNFRTTRADIERTLDVILDAARELEP